MPALESPAFDVLIADDDADIRDLLAEWFKTKGLGVATVTDGRAGVSELQRSNGRYGLVLADINMPGADGFAVLQAARESSESTYVVMMTGFASLDTAINAVRSGAQDYLTKPFTLAQIDVVLERVNARFALEREHRRLTQASGPGSLSSIESRLASIERTLAHVHALVSRP